MTRVQKIVQTFLNHIKDQNVLEAACGRAEFAICASTYAKSVHCIDLTDSRLLPEASEHTNLFFSVWTQRRWTIHPPALIRLFFTIQLPILVRLLNRWWKNVSGYCVQGVRC